MAVSVNPESSRLTLVRETGVDHEGKPVIKRSSYSVDKDATDEQVYAVAQALATLCEYPTTRIERVDQKSLAGEDE